MYMLLIILQCLADQCCAVLCCAVRAFAPKSSSFCTSVLLKTGTSFKPNSISIANQ